jgi:hypothetical protein
MFKRSWAFTLLMLAVPSAAARAETVLFPPFVRGAAHGSQMIVPQCVPAGDRMSCQLMVLSVFASATDEPGDCQLYLGAQSIEFRREDANTWVGDYTIAYCSIKNTIRLVQSSGPPRRVMLRVSYELGEKSEACLKADREFREKAEWKEALKDLEWIETGSDKFIPFRTPACKSFAVGPGEFPAAAFPR